MIDFPIWLRYRKVTGLSRLLHACKEKVEYRTFCHFKNRKLELYLFYFSFPALSTPEMLHHNTCGDNGFYGKYHHKRTNLGSNAKFQSCTIGFQKFSCFRI